MDRSERIRLIQRCRDALEMMPDDDVDLHLTTFDIGSVPEDGFGNGPSLTQWLTESASDSKLLALGQHLGVLENAAVETPSAAGEAVPLFIFASHLATHRGFLGEVEAELQRYRVRMFVAHDSIPMDADWAKEIVEALNACHAGAAFLHDGFHASYYCQQECGWMLGRGIPVARLMFGESPRGLLGEHQGKQMLSQSAAEVAALLMDWATEKASLSAHLGASLSLALEYSNSYKATDRVWERLRRLPEVSPTALRRIIFAAENNGQVYGANVGGWSGGPYRPAIAQQASQWDSGNLYAERIDRLMQGDVREGILPPQAELREHMQGY